jgi:hypothetical protein
MERRAEWKKKDDAVDGKTWCRPYSIFFGAQACLSSLRKGVTVSKECESGERRDIGRFSSSGRVELSCLAFADPLKARCRLQDGWKGIRSQRQLSARVGKNEAGRRKGRTEERSGGVLCIC